jgi:hypothetical protein
MRLQDIGDDARRQYIDARTTFEAWEAAKRQVAEVRGNMRWKVVDGKEYLVRTAGRSETGLGARSSKTEQIFDRFQARKHEAEDRVAGLERQLARQQKMNRAHLVGRSPQILVEILLKLESAGLAEHFVTIGTHSLYAYESAAGARFESEALATRDIDVLWDTRKRVSFVTQMKVLESSLLGILKKVDKTFQIHPDQRYTAVNADAFEVDIIRREPTNGDPHPLKLTDDDEELYAVPAERAEVLLSSKRFSAVIVSASGRMARMTTVAPLAFADFKRWMAQAPGREDLKRSRDQLQAELVEELVEEYLPQWGRGSPIAR